MRSLRSCVMAAISAAKACRSGSGISIGWADQGPAASGISDPTWCRMRALMTLGTSRAPTRSRLPIAAARAWAASRPASSAVRRVRHCHRRAWVADSSWVGSGGGVDHLLRVTTADPRVLVVVAEA